MNKRLLSIVTVSAITLSLFSIQPAVTHAALPASASGATGSIFGPNVYVFDPSMDNAKIQQDVTSVFTQQESSQFGDGRYALLFKPGTYNDVNVRVGFYEQVAGLGLNPDDVFVNKVNADAKWDNGNATQNFWRSVENLSFGKTADDAFFAVSQAAPMRRAHVKSKSLLLFDFDPWWNAGWASGGYIADSKVDTKIIPGSQQQFFSRNNDYGEWAGSLWNMLLVGDKNPPANTFPSPAITVVDKAPVIKEKPYLYYDNATSAYKVFIPAVQTDRKGVSWPNTPGTSKDVASEFYIAQPGVTAATINAQLNSGKSLIFTPGIYHLNDTINVTKPNTVVMGLGLAAIEEDTGKTAMKVADVEGVSVSGLMFEAGLTRSPSLLEVGSGKNADNHSANPILLSDLFFRVGGTDAGTTNICLIINSNNVIGDHFWIWRADHGDGAGWDSNYSKNGLVVNGDDVTLYGLFNEHHEEYQTIWNGNGGRTYFYQTEIPYDPPTQEAWMSHEGTVNGFASYKVADNVTTHEAWGLGLYANFTAGPVKLQNAVEVPKVEGVKLHSLITVFLSGIAGSGITHIINDTGPSVYSNNPMTATMAHYSSGDTQPPTVPTNVTATAVSGLQVDLTWHASTDNVAVAAYDIYRDGKLVGSTGVTTYSDKGVRPEKNYKYTIIARDSEGNKSGFSDLANVTTLKYWMEINKSGWTVLTSHNPGAGNANANRIIDGVTTNSWDTGAAMAVGMNFIVDMKTPKNFGRVVFQSGGTDYARGYAVSVSDDGTNWGTPVATGTDANVVIKPGSNAIVTADFNTVTARYVKVELTTAFSPNWWKVNEFSVYTDKELPLERNDWTAITAPSNADGPNLFDGSATTRWSAGTPMVPGQSITIDMKNEQLFNTIVMDSGNSTDYSRSYEIYVSSDGVNWGTAIANKTAAGPYIVSEFADQTARYIKIVQTGTNAGWWSIYELNVYRDSSNPIAVSSINVTGAADAGVITTKGGKLQMSAAVYPAYADDTAVTWSVTNTDNSVTDKATINQDGMLTAGKNGQVKVIATAADGSVVSGSKVITISGQIQVANIVVNSAGDATEILTKAGTLQLSAEVLPADADNRTLIWTVANEDGTTTDKATISAGGLLTAVQNGIVKVVATATDGSGVNGSKIITISGQNIVTSIQVTGTGGVTTISTKAGSLQLSAEVLPTNAINKSVTWSVYNVDGSATDLATIGLDGLLTAVKDGSVKAVAKAQDGSGVTGEATITISGQSQTDTGCTVNCGGGGYVPPLTPPITTEPLKANQQLVTSAELKNDGKAVILLSDGKTEAVVPIDAAQNISKSVEVKASGVSVIIPPVLFRELAGKLQGKSDDSKIIVRIVENTSGNVGTDDGAFKLGDHMYNLDLVLVDKDGNETKLPRFSEPATVVLPYDSDMNKDLIGIYYYDENSKKWAYIGGKVDADKHTITGSTSHFSKYAVLEYDQSFVDVQSSHWAYNTLKVLTARHIVTGVTATEFKPNGSTTRAEFVALLVRALGLKATSTNASFSDVNASDWYAQDVAAAYEAGLISGLSDTEFAPQAQITREQMAILLVRAYEYVKGASSPTSDHLTDLKDREQVSSWATAGVNKAIELGLMKGHSESTFVPQSNAIRAETAQAILNLMIELETK